MAIFPLPQRLGSLHNDVIAYASAIQCTIAEHGGCQSLASEALNVLVYNAVLTHRGVRSLCEEGWTPITPILNRTLLDIFANCIALLNRPDSADYMGFKYISDFYRKWLVEPDITEPERREAFDALEALVAKLSPADQERARTLIREGRPRTYWFQPEYNTTKELLEFSPEDIYRIYRLLSPITHGGFAARILFKDDPRSEDINPREHPRNTVRSIAASCRLLLEVCHVQDQRDNHGVGEETYQELLQRIHGLRET